MSTASERISLVGLTLADAYEISTQLRERTLLLRDASCALQAEGGDYRVFERERAAVLLLREKLSRAIDKTLRGVQESVADDDGKGLTYTRV